MSEPTVIIEEVMDRAQQGATAPFVCQGDDGFVYYVKGIGANRRSQICEWVSAQLAQLFGLPIAPFVLAEVPEELIAARVRPDIQQLGSGIVFASRQLPHVQDLTPTTRKKVPAALGLDILVFDWWIRNEDRHLTELGGNPNLLWNMSSQALAVIDHNLAFDASFNPTSFLDSHAFAANWNQVFGDQLERDRYQTKMEAALAELAAIRDSIPAPWWFQDEGVPADICWDEIAETLMRCHRDDFWNLP